MWLAAGWPHLLTVQNVGGVKLWQNHSTHAFERENFGEFSKCCITLQFVDNVWMWKLWQFTDFHQIRQCFPQQRFLCYTVRTYICTLVMEQYIDVLLYHDMSVKAMLNKNTLGVKKVRGQAKAALWVSLYMWPKSFISTEAKKLSIKNPFSYTG